MRFGSVCSGIEAASVAWHPLGWKAAWLSEIEPFPSAVLKYHYPDVPNLGDMTLLPDRIASGEVEAPDLFCGGTPCQAFSVAGLRKSLDDARGNLSLVFCEIANAIDKRRTDAGLVPGIIFWENVPGVLSTKDNAFGCFIAGLAGETDPVEPPRGKWPNAGVVLGPQRTVAWRVLDAQYFGVAQRRRRVFVVASARDGFDPASVLLEFDSVRRDSAPSRKAREESSASAGASSAERGNCRGLAPTLDANMDRKWGSDQWTNNGFAIIEPTVMSSGQANAEIRTDGGTPALTCLHEAPIAAMFIAPAEVRPCMGSSGPPYSRTGNERVESEALACTTQPPMQVRRLTPVECERLQGFSDGYTAIPWRNKPAKDCPDGPRYKALGNSWAVPVVRWIGARIAAAVSI